MLSNTGVNKIILLGEITTHPQVSNEANNEVFTKFNLVTNELIKKGTSMVEHNEHHIIKVPGKLISQDSLVLQVGQIVYIEGKIQTTSFRDERGVKRYDLEIIANKIELLNLVPIESIRV